MSSGAAAERARYHRAWYVYDFANQAFATTVLAVFLGPYLTDVAERAARPDGRVEVFGLAIRAGSLYSYTLAASVIAAAPLMPVVAAIADRTERDRELLAAFSFTGAAATSSMYFVSDDRYLLGAGLLFTASVMFSVAGVIYSAYLPRIATPDERDGVSARGSAAGFAGGSILLVLNLGLFLAHDRFGRSEGEAVRISLASAGLWWAVFTLVPVRVLGGAAVRRTGSHVPAGGTLAQLRQTVAGLRRRPKLLVFVAAYLLLQEGIQTVVSHASLYGDEELGLSETTLIVAILVVQVVAVGGALAFGRMAARVGAKRTVLGGLVVWMVVVGIGYGIPAEQPLAFYVLAALIALVLGGVPALARSMFSQMIPAGREAEYFSLFSIVNKGTSALGPLVFGLSYDITGSYRASILVIEVFFLAAILVLMRVDVAGAIAEAGNPPPRRI